MQIYGDGGGAGLRNGLAGGMLSLFSCQRQAQDVPNSASSPLQCKRTRFCRARRLSWLIGKAGQACLRWWKHGKGTSAKFQTGAGMLPQRVNTVCQARPPESQPQDPHGGRREPSCLPPHTCCVIPPINKEMLAFPISQTGSFREGLE